MYELAPNVAGGGSEESAKDLRTQNGENLLMVPGPQWEHSTATHSITAQKWVSAITEPFLWAMPRAGMGRFVWLGMTVSRRNSRRVSRPERGRGRGKIMETYIRRCL